MNEQRPYLLKPQAGWRMVAGAMLGVLALLLFGLGTARAEEDMSFQIVSAGNPAQCGASCPQMIAAEGQISDQTPGRFLAFISEQSNRPNLHKIVLLNSYGGKVVAAMQLGRIFRQIGAAVVVAEPNSAGGRCFSACVYALMGGKKRIIPQESQAGIHRMVAYDEGYDSQFSDGAATRRLDNGTVASVLSRYCASMGVNPALISLAERTSPDSLHILSRSEISQWRLASSRW